MTITTIKKSSGVFKASVQNPVDVKKHVSKWDGKGSVPIDAFSLYTTPKCEVVKSGEEELVHVLGSFFDILCTSESDHTTWQARTKNHVMWTWKSMSMQDLKLVAKASRDLSVLKKVQP